MAEARPRAPRVLLVDDDAENLVMLSEVLTSEGIDVVGTATDGEAGLMAGRPPSECGTNHTSGVARHSHERP